MYKVASMQCWHISRYHIMFKIHNKNELQHCGIYTSIQNLHEIDAPCNVSLGDEAARIQGLGQTKICQDSFAAPINEHAASRQLGANNSQGKQFVGKLESMCASTRIVHAKQQVLTVCCDCHLKSKCLCKQCARNATCVHELVPNMRASNV